MEIAFGFLGWVIFSFGPIVYIMVKVTRIERMLRDGANVREAAEEEDSQD